MIFTMVSAYLKLEAQWGNRMRLIKSCMALLIIALAGTGTANAASKVDIINFSINNCSQHFDKEKNDEFKTMSDAQKVENIYPLIELFMNSSQENLEKEMQDAPPSMACLAQQVLKIKRNGDNIPSDAPSNTASTTGSDDANMSTGTCATYEQCVQTENDSGLAEKLDALPAENVNLKTRGIIATSDFMIANYQQCLPDSRCQKLVDQHKKTRADTLIVCQKVSTDINSCKVSPF